MSAEKNVNTRKAKIKVLKDLISLNQQVESTFHRKNKGK